MVSTKMDLLVTLKTFANSRVYQIIESSLNLCIIVEVIGFIIQITLQHMLHSDRFHNCWSNVRSKESKLQQSSTHYPNGRTAVGTTGIC